MIKPITNTSIRLFRLLSAECRRSYMQARTYPLATFTGIVIMYLLFMALFFGMKSVSNNSITRAISQEQPIHTGINNNLVNEIDQKVGQIIEAEPTKAEQEKQKKAFGKSIDGYVIGYCLWFFAIIALNTMGFNLEQEAVSGTLEQLFINPSGILTVLLTRAVASFLVSIWSVGFLLLLLMVSTGRWLHLPMLLAIPIIILTIMGLYGLGLILAAASLLAKRVGQFGQMVQFGLLFLAFTPIEKFDPISAFLIRNLPLSVGAEILRRLVNPDLTLSVTFGFYIHLIIVGVIYLLIGILVFNHAILIAKRNGLIGHY